MEQYIKKSDIVAEIKRLLNVNSKFKTEYVGGKNFVLKQILSFLDTIETKEVDLEKEIKDYIYTLPHSRTGIPGGWKCSWPEEEVIKIVKHFLDLG